MAEPLITVRKLCKSYFLAGGQELRILKELSLEVLSGEVLAIVGASGAGKSTLLHILGALDRPSSGSVRYRGQDAFAKDETALAAFRNREMGFIFQFHHLLPEFSALENVMMPLLIAQRPRGEAQQRARRLLEEVGLSRRLEHKPGELSGGEQQRVAIARALANHPSLVLADEPTGNLDSHTSSVVFSLLKDLSKRKNTTCILVTHNQTLATRADRTLHLVDGQLQNST